QFPIAAHTKSSFPIPAERLGQLAERSAESIDIPAHKPLTACTEPAALKIEIDRAGPGRLPAGGKLFLAVVSGHGNFEVRRSFDILFAMFPRQASLDRRLTRSFPLELG